MTRFLVTARCFPGIRSETEPGMRVGKEAGYMRENNDNAESL